MPEIQQQTYASPRDIIDQAGLNNLFSNLKSSQDKFDRNDQQFINQTFGSLQQKLEHLKGDVSYLTKDRGANLKKMSPDNLNLIIEVIADSPQEAERLKTDLARGSFEEIVRAIERSQSNPEKLIEIAEIMLMESTIPDSIKRSIYNNLREINSFLRPLLDIGEKYALVMPVLAFGTDSENRREAYAAEMSGFLERRSLWLKAKVVDTIVDLLVPTQEEKERIIQEIKEKIKDNQIEQSDLRRKLFLLNSDQKQEYRELMRKLVNLVGDESYLKDQQFKYEAAAVIGL